MTVWLHAETCTWFPVFWIYSYVWWTNVWIYVYCNTTGWITTKLRWFILNVKIKLKVLENSVYSANVPTETRMEVPSLPNWVLFQLQFVSSIFNFCKIQFYHERVSGDFFVGYFNSRNVLLPLTSNMLCGWKKRCGNIKKLPWFLRWAIFASVRWEYEFFCVRSALLVRRKLYTHWQGLPSQATITIFPLATA
jgi:hypothetical protein